MQFHLLFIPEKFNILKSPGWQRSRSIVLFNYLHPAIYYSSNRNIRNRNMYNRIYPHCSLSHYVPCKHSCGSGLTAWDYLDPTFNNKKKHRFESDQLKLQSEYYFVLNLLSLDFKNISYDLALIHWSSNPNPGGLQTKSGSASLFVNTYLTLITLYSWIQYH